MTTNSRRANEHFIVSLAARTTMPVTGTLSNTTTGAVNLLDGQLGFVATSANGTTGHWSFTDATPTLAEAPQIAIVQGTPYSANPTTLGVPYPLWARPYEIIQPIEGRNQEVRVTKQAFTEARHNIFQIGVANAASTGNVNVLDNTAYQLAIRFTGRRQEELYGRSQTAMLRANFAGANFSATGLNLSTTLARDYILTNLAVDINQNSEALTGTGIRKGSDPVVCFGLGIATATGATEIATLAVGQVVPVYKNAQGVIRSITLTSEMLASIAAASAASPAFTHILTVSLADAGITTGGTVEALWIMATDERIAFVDYMPQVKVYLQVGLTAGFNSAVNVAELVKGNEGQGYGRVLDLQYKATQGQRKYAGQHHEDPVINFPSPVLTTEKYVVYTINYGTPNPYSVFTGNSLPHKAIICIPAESAPTVTNALIATFDSTLNSWLTSTGNTVIN